MALQVKQVRAASIAGSASSEHLSAFEQTVGNTRLVRLKHASEVTGCDILAKAEYENPGGSVKVCLFRVLSSSHVLAPGL